ncbi:MAG: DHH family phosphoesterase [Candidatus Hermodarchaeota archaeon]
MIVSLTHEHDLDGLGAQAIIKRHFTLKSDFENDNISYFFADYTNFVEIIIEILNTDPTPTELIISDLGFNDSFKEVFPYFQDAKNKGCIITWFDHHIVDTSIQEELKALIHIYINDPEKCAAEIVKDYFLKDDPIAAKIARFARDTDFRTDKYKLASDLQSIIGFNRGVQNDQNKNKIVSLLSQGDFDNPWFMEQLNVLNKWLEKESAHTLNHAIVVPLESFGELVVSWANIGGGKITRILKPKYPDAKAFIGIDTRNNDIIIYSDFINCREFARIFDGGGHKERAGFKYSPIFERTNVLNNAFIESIKENILKQA